MIGERRRFGKGCYVWELMDGVTVMDAEYEVVLQYFCTIERQAATQVATTVVEIVTTGSCL